MVSAIKFRLMPPQAYVVIIGSPVYKAVLKAMELLGGGGLTGGSRYRALTVTPALGSGCLFVS